MNKYAGPLVAIILLVVASVFFYNLKNTNDNPIQDSADQEFRPLQQEQPVQNMNQNNATVSGELKIEDLKVGEGAEAKAGDTVEVHYVGTLVNGEKFDSSYDRNQSFSTQIGVGNVIEGWDKGILGMKVGGKRRLTVPPDLGYGGQAAGSIPPNSTLIFEVELLSIK